MFDILLFLFHFIIFSHCQINLRYIKTINYPSGFGCSIISDNGNSVLMSVFENNQYQIVKLNITDFNNITQLGTYFTPNRNDTPKYMYLVKGYLIASFGVVNPQFFDYSTFQYLGDSNYTATFVRGEYLESQNVFIFSQISGKIGYFHLDNIPFINPIYLNTNTANGVSFLAISNDKQYVSFGYGGSPEVTVWRTSNWTLVKNISILITGVNTLYFSQDNKFFIIFLMNSTSIEIYDVQNGFNLIERRDILHKGVKSCFYNQQTNSVTLLSQSSNAILSMNMYDYQTKIIQSNIPGFRMMVNEDLTRIIIFNVSLKNTFLYEIDPYCQSNEYFNKSNKFCMQCQQNCDKCINATFCTICSADYSNVNGQCIYKANGAVQLMSYLLLQNSLIKYIIKLPGSRTIFNPLLSFLFNIDKLFFYVYHRKDHGIFMNRLLLTMKKLQEEKWKIISDNIKIGYQFYNFQNQKTYLDFKQHYTSKKYWEIQNEGSSFLANTIEFNLISLPLIIVFFYLFQFIFQILFKYKISKIFRIYSFGGFLFFMIMEGNVDFFSYWFTYDCTKFFHFNYEQKITNFFVSFLFFLFVFYTFSGYFLLKIVYNNLAKHFFDNCQINIRGNLQIVVENGYLGFFLSIVHLIFEDFSTFQLQILFLIESSYIFFTIQSIKSLKVFKNLLTQWAKISFSVLRLCFIFTYYFDTEDNQLNIIIQDTQIILVTLYLFQCICVIAGGIFQLILRILNFFGNSFASEQNKKDKKHFCHCCNRPRFILVQNQCKYSDDLLFLIKEMMNNKTKCDNKSLYSVKNSATISQGIINLQIRINISQKMNQSMNNNNKISQAIQFSQNNNQNYTNKNMRNFNDINIQKDQQNFIQSVNEIGIKKQNLVIKNSHFYQQYKRRPNFYKNRFSENHQKRSFEFS